MQLLSSLATVATCALSFNKSVNQKILWPYAAFVTAFVGFKKFKEIFTPNPLHSTPDWEERKEKDKLIDEILDWLESPNSSPNSWIRKAELFLNVDFEHLPEKRILVIVCPTSGTGQAMKYWKQVVVPVLNAMGITKLTVKETEYVGHATEIVSSANLDEFDAIAHLGGDGTSYEIWAALYERNQLDFPMAFFACGSGNATGSCANQVNPSLSFKGDATMIDSCLTLAKWNIVPFDLMEYHVRWVDGQVSKHVAHIGIVMGNHSYIVRMANSLRWTRLGGYRYVLLTYWTWLNNYDYPVECSILPEEKTNADTPPFDQREMDNRWVKPGGPLQFLTVTNYWFFGSDPRKNNDGLSDGLLYVIRGGGFNRLRLWKECIGSTPWAIFCSDVDKKDSFPDGIEFCKAKAIHCKFHGPKTHWKRKLLVYDGEYGEGYVDEIQVRSLASAARLFSVK